VKRNVVLALLIMLVMVSSGAFGEDPLLFELPEPVFIGASLPETGGAPAVSLVPGISPQDFQELVYLWTLDPRDSSETISFIPLYTLAAAASPDALDVPFNIRNNQYYTESVRLTKLAQENFDYGDYDVSTNYAEEAARYAQLSDEYVALQLRIKGANDALAAANNRLTWASAQKAPERYPQEYARAEAAYDEAVTNMDNEKWEDARDAANRAVTALANVRALSAPENRQGTQTAAAPVENTDRPRNDDNRTGPSLPAQYAVRPWAIAKDCLWNIAGRPWAYGDPTKWKILYNANKSRMPDPNNPDLIHPGMILDIPSIQGELRSGMWSANTSYTPIR
jgi:hypothetical protein